MAQDVEDAGPGTGENSTSIANRLVGDAGKRLVVLAESGTLLHVIWRWLRALTVVLTVGYAVFILVLWVSTAVVGERNLTSAFLLYLPPSLWVLPVIPLLFLGLVFHRGCLLGQLLLAAIFAWGWMGYRLRGGDIGTSDRNPATLTIMTYNRGQHMGQSLQPFKNATQPDLLVLQEAPGRALGFRKAPEYQEFSAAQSIGEFTLLSRFPITEFSLVPAVPGHGVRAARFVVDWNGRAISVYAVHLQTPRAVLSSYQRGAFLWGVLGLPGTPWAEKRRHNQKFWDDQIMDAQSILNAVRQDPNPCLVAGDFNAPHNGYIHRLLTRHLGDAHSEAGRGFGFTFPGSTRNPLSAGGPWMRIDYVFFSRAWKAVACVTEADRPSQHRAVAAKLSLDR